MVACAEIWGKRGSMKLFFHIKTNALFMSLLFYDFREALPRRKPSCASSLVLYIGRSVLIELCRFIIVGTNWSSSTSGEASVIIPAASKFKSLSLGRESLSRSTWSFSHCSDLMLRLFLTCLLCWLLFCLLPCSSPAIRSISKVRFFMWRQIQPQLAVGFGELVSFAEMVARCSVIVPTYSVDVRYSRSNTAWEGCHFVQNCLIKTVRGLFRLCEKWTDPIACHFESR